jgi:hypothetical protein
MELYDSKHPDTRVPKPIREKVSRLLNICGNALYDFLFYADYATVEDELGFNEIEAAFEDRRLVVDHTNKVRRALGKHFKGDEQGEWWRDLIGRSLRDGEREGILLRIATALRNTQASPDGVRKIFEERVFLHDVAEALEGAGTDSDDSADTTEEDGDDPADSSVEVDPYILRARAIKLVEDLTRVLHRLRNQPQARTPEAVMALIKLYSELIGWFDTYSELVDVGVKGLIRREGCSVREFWVLIGKLIMAVLKHYRPFVAEHVDLLPPAPIEVGSAEDGSGQDDPECSQEEENDAH